jgi:transposase-like protein
VSCPRSLPKPIPPKTAKNHAELHKWRERSLDAFPYLILDARYEKVRQNGQLLDCAVLLAMGVGADGRRALLGVSVALSEAEVARAIRSVFECPSRPAADLRLKEIVAHYAKGTPKLATWMEENLPLGLTVLALPVGHQKRLRTSHALERVNQEIKRRTRVAEPIRKFVCGSEP